MATTSPRNSASKKTGTGKPKAKKTATTTPRSTAGGAATAGRVARGATGKTATTAGSKKTAARGTPAVKGVAKPAGKRGAAAATRAAPKTASVAGARDKPGRRSTPAKPAGKPAQSASGVSPYRITSDEALDNTRKLLADKKARSRRTPAWQAHEDTHPPGHVPAPGFESGSARDQAELLHRGEIRLDAIQGSGSDQDRRQQGKRDSR